MNSADGNREVIRSKILISQQIDSDAVTITKLLANRLPAAAARIPI
jgi:hypothetical protein